MRQRWLATIGVAVCALFGLHMNSSSSLPLELDARYEAYEFLKSLPREWSRSSATDCRTYEDKNVDRLSPAFAASAAAFLKAFTAIHGTVTITSANRTAQEQTCVCVGERGPCAGKPRIVKTKKRVRVTKRGTSRHQLGIALDIRPGTGSDEEFNCLHQFAQRNPHFGVRFPLGKRDRPHMEFAAPAATVKVAALSPVSAPPTACQSRHRN